jgi:hypothetical protein
LGHISTLIQIINGLPKKGLEDPSGLSQPKAWQASRESSARVRLESSAINALINASSDSLKSRPQ